MTAYSGRATCLTTAVSLLAVVCCQHGYSGLRDDQEEVSPSPSPSLSPTLRTSPSLGLSPSFSFISPSPGPSLIPSPSPSPSLSPSPSFTSPSPSPSLIPSPSPSPDPSSNHTEDGLSNNHTSKEDQSFSISCNPGAMECESLSLDEIATNASSESNRGKPLTVYINVSELQLQTTARFSNISRVAIHGGHATLTCGDLVGIEMKNVGDIQLEDITIQKCGTLLRVGEVSNFVAGAAVHIMWCNRITIRRTAITQSLGAGLNMQRNTGDVLVEHSNFTDNSLEAGSDHIDIGGNGVIVFITQTASGSRYSFVNCTFSRNKAAGIRYDFILSTLHFGANSSSSSSGERGFTQGRGGGIRITIGRWARRVLVMLNNSRFENNTAFLGAGLSAEIEGEGEGNALTIIDTDFTGNGCQSSSGIGGGAYLSFEGLNRPNASVTNYTMNLTRATFNSNCAELGGGTYFFSDSSNTEDTVNRIEFDTCTWQNNSAHTGSAVDIAPNIFKRAQMGYLSTPVFRNCVFVNNTIQTSVAGNHHAERQSYGSGTLYSSLTSIEFQSNVHFEGNFGSGIVIVNGAANFTHSNATFVGNSGIRGGAILMIGTASMTVGSGQNYSFLRNNANDRGGAIYSYLVDDMDFIVSRSCFIQYSDPEKQADIIPSRNWTASLVFEGNKARNLGHSIYATSVFPCQVISRLNPIENDSIKTIYETLQVNELFQPPGIVIKPNNGTQETQEIATEASHFRRKSEDVLKVIPGKPTDLGVSILDDFGEEVQATLTAYTRNGSVDIDSEFSCITDHTIKLKGNEEGKGQLVLQTLGTRKISLMLNVELLPCPPGFNLTNKECECNSEMYVGIDTCKEYSALLTRGFWAGFVGDKELGTSICPVGFCSYNDSDTEMDVVVLSENPSDLEQAVCGPKRRGILCGECTEGYTTFYHSPHFNCREAKPLSCKLGWLFYILSELAPVTLLFLFVLVLNISFTTGAVNGFILFSQLLDTLLIDASGVIKFPEPITALTRGYQVIYGFFTLDLFTIEPLSFCLWENASVLDVLAFKYVTVGYSLFLVLSVILFMKYKAARCFGRYYSITTLRNSVIHGLSGFLMLSYAQVIKVSFSILYSQDISLGQEAYSRTGQLPQLNRVFFNGNIAHLSREHLGYAIPAILVLLVIGVCPPLLLLGYPLMNKVFIVLRLEKSWFVRCLNRASRLKPLLDSFQGCFKDNFRFFAGVYFFYRWLVALTYAIVSQLSLFYTVTQALLITILVVHSVCQPYQKHWHNVLDTLFFANLVVINGLTSLHYYSVRVDGQIRNSALNTATMSIQVFLIYLPLVYIAAYTTARLLGKTCCKAVKDEPSKEDFVLKKIGKRIYHSSFSSSGRDSVVENSLPYRLFNREEGSPFEESIKGGKEDSTITDTYL